MTTSDRTRPRPAVKALIVRDDAVLVTVNTGWTPEFLLLPGGGQDHGESMREALVRECREEVGADVTVGEVAFVRDYIGAHHEFAEQDDHYHAIEIAFWATLSPGSEPELDIRSDTFQTGARWLPLSELDDAPLWPQELKRWLRLPPEARPTYLGDVN